MTEAALLMTDTGPGVVTLTMHRPEQCNALNEDLIAQMTQTIATLGREENLRTIILTGHGDSFCSGTDITWMEELAYGQAENDARRLGNLLLQLRRCPKPVIGRINGPAIGAGVGLVACCDILVCAQSASFALPAVHLGSVPAVMGPFLTETMGVHQVRRFSLTGERFSPEEAMRIGLVHQVCPDTELDAAVLHYTQELAKGSPKAIMETKILLNAFGHDAPSPSLLDGASKISKRVRKTKEAREGLAAFIEKRLPSWRK